MHAPCLFRLFSPLSLPSFPSFPPPPSSTRSHSQFHVAPTLRITRPVLIPIVNNITIGDKEYRILTVGSMDVTVLFSPPCIAECAFLMILPRPMALLLFRVSRVRSGDNLTV